MGYINDLRKKVGHEPLLLTRTSVVVLDEEKRILLQKRPDGKWNVPGGFMELEETAEEAGRREVKEETGIEVGELSLLGIFSGKDYFEELPNGDQVYPLTIQFLTAHIQNGKPREGGGEALEAKFFPLERLPENISLFAKEVIDKFSPSFY